jgi:hypothetical protein
MKWRETEENCRPIMRSFIICRLLFSKYEDEDEMGGACSAHGKYEKGVKNFDWKA